MNTIFLATVIGWYLVITSLFTLLKFNEVKEVMSEALTQRGLLLILAIITLILGLLMVASHNLWVMGWPVVVTILSWVVLLSGLLRLFCQKTAIKTGQFFLSNPVYTKIAALVFLVVGLYLLAHVYSIPYIGTVLNV